MSFAILRTTSLCLLGSRIRWWRVMDINDGAGLQGSIPLHCFFFISCLNFALSSKRQ